MKRSSSHWFAFVVGGALLGAMMTTDAVLVWRQFGIGRVLLAELGLLLAAAAFTAVGRPKMSFPRLAASAYTVQALVGAGFAIVAFFACFAPISLYKEYYQTFPMMGLDAGIKFHQDTAFHSALIQSILNFGYPSTGQHLTPVTFYYTLSHYTDAFACWLGGFNAYAAAGLLFHFKKLIIVLAIGLFIARSTSGRSGLFRSLSFVFLLPVFIGTWTVIGSEGLWTASVLLLAAAPQVWKILTAAAPTRRNYWFLTAVLLLVGLAKFASGLMLALFIGLILMQVRLRSRRLWTFAGIWLAMYAVMAYLFSISNTTAQLPTSLSSSLGYWLVVGANRSRPALTALYVLLVLFVLLWARLRTDALRRFVIAQAAALVVLGVLASHFAKTDQFYFTYGGLFVVLMFGVPLGLGELRVSARKPMTLAVAAAIIVATAAVPQTSLHVFGSTPHTVSSAVTKANVGFFSDYNKVTGKHLSMVRLLRGAKVGKVAPGAASKFVSALDAFRAQHGLTPQNAVLFIPKHVFLHETGFMVGKFWGRGMLMYAMTGVPLVHGSPMLWVGYGFGNYTAADLWTNSPTDLDQIRAAGKNVIVVRSILSPRFVLLGATR